MSKDKSSKSLINNSNGVMGASLPRVDSLKELMPNTQTQIDKKHFVKEDLVILENLNDSSCTPGELNTLINLNNSKILEFKQSRKANYIVEKNEEEL